MAENELHEKIVLEGVEHAESGLHRLAGAVGRVAGAFDGMTEVAGALGGLGGIWKLAEGFQEASNLYSAVGRISRATGMTAVQAHGMFEAFEQSGVELEAAESVMTSMARMAGKIGGSLSVTAEQSALMNRHMQSLGVNIKKGPQEQMLAMAEAAQRGKLHMQDLVAVFGVQRTQAERMFLLLKRGPEAMRDTFKEVANSSGVIDAAALESFAEMKKSRAELKSAWDDLVRTLYKAVIPGVTKIIEAVRDGFDAIKPIAASIGSVLAGHMREVVALTKVWLALVAANKVANFAAPIFGGKKMGLLGEGEEAGRIETLGKRLWGFAGKLITPSAPAAGGIARGAGLLEGTGGFFVRLVGQVGTKLGIIGVIITAVIGAFELLRKNVWGVRDWFVTMFHNIGASVSDAFHKIVAVFAKLMEAVKPIAAVLGGALLISLRMFGFWVEMMGHVLNVVMDAIILVINSLIWAFNHTLAHLPGIGKLDMIDLDAKKEAAKRAADRPDAEGKGQQVYQDFRGSKFEIENNFPATIDGGRVAVAFGDEMARLGERRVDSGLRPLYSYR